MFNKVPNIPQSDFANQQNNYSIGNEVNKLADNPILNGRLISGISLSSTEKSIEHKLNRSYQGFFVVSLNANAVIYISGDNDKDKFIKLKASASCTADIWVF